MRVPPDDAAGSRRSSSSLRQQHRRPPPRPGSHGAAAAAAAHDSDNRRDACSMLWSRLQSELQRWQDSLAVRERRTAAAEAATAPMTYALADLRRLLHASPPSGLPDPLTFATVAERLVCAAAGVKSSTGSGSAAAFTAQGAGADAAAGCTGNGKQQQQQQTVHSNELAAVLAGARDIHSAATEELQRLQELHATSAADVALGQSFRRFMQSDREVAARFASWQSESQPQQPQVAAMQLLEHQQQQQQPAQGLLHAGQLHVQQPLTDAATERCGAAAAAATASGVTAAAAAAEPGITSQGNDCYSAPRDEEGPAPELHRPTKRLRQEPQPEYAAVVSAPMISSSGGDAAAPEAVSGARMHCFRPMQPPPRPRHGAPHLDQVSHEPPQPPAAATAAAGRMVVNSCKAEAVAALQSVLPPSRLLLQPFTGAASAMPLHNAPSSPQVTDQFLHVRLPHQQQYGRSTSAGRPLHTRQQQVARTAVLQRLKRGSRGSMLRGQRGMSSNGTRQPDASDAELAAAVEALRQAVT
jgi:hypothetical protein